MTDSNIYGTATNDDHQVLSWMRTLIIVVGSTAVATMIALAGYLATL